MISLKEVTITCGSNVLIENLNYKFKSGKLNYITGSSGSGKTTLLNVIGLISTNYEGSILIDGLEAREIRKRKRISLYRYKLGFVFQNYGLIETATIKENLLIALKFKKMTRKQKIDRIKETLELLNLNLEIDRKIYELSGGQQQRIALARIMLKDCDIILADEPTGSLDNENERKIIQVLRELSQNGKVVIIVTHNRNLIKEEDNWIDINGLK